MADMQAQLRALGRDFTPEQIEKTRDLYIPVALRATPDFCTVTRDHAYGSDPRQRLDVFVPAKGGAGLPVVAFVHGGGFIGGDKGGADAPFHNHFGAWAVRAGFVGVTITYRLAPASVWPSGAEDMAAAVAWLRVNIAGHGGDPGKIFLIGQSAGASHIASYLAREETREAAAASLRAAVLLSGVYDVARAERNLQNNSYYGEDASRFAAQSSLEGLARTSVPLLLTVSELEPAQFQRQAAWAVERIVAAKDRWPAFFWLRGHNHLSPILQIGSAHDDLGPKLASMIATPDGWT
jgi:triacylglycerol lipase